jgi:N-acetyl-anhydromuramyl-L-alanine amidase AmpD
MEPRLKLDFDRSLRLPEGQWFPEVYPKRQIYLHHTVGGSAKSTVDWWIQDPGRIGTAYIVERDGRIFEVFPPEHWAHHIGKGSMISHNQVSIGIELASEGALTQRDDGQLLCFDGKRVFMGQSVDLMTDWRGYKYFDVYEEAQVISVCWLVRWLCDTFSIPKKLIPFDDKNIYRPELRDTFQGVLGHCNVREDKTDPNPSFNWKLLQRILQEEDV